MSERRLGRRSGAAGIDVDWDSPVRSARFRRRRPLAARLLEVSVTGAMVMAERDRRILVGTEVSISFGPGVRATGVVRHVKLGDTADVALYGVEFRNQSEAFVDRVRAMGRAQTAPTEWFWATPR